MTVAITQRSPQAARNNETNEGASSPDFPDSIPTNQHNCELDTSRIARELGLPDDDNVIPRVRALAKHAGIEAESTDELVEALQNMAKESEGEESVFQKILLGKDLKIYKRFLEENNNIMLIPFLCSFVDNGMDLDLLSCLINSTLKGLKINEFHFEGILSQLKNREDIGNNPHVKKFIDLMIGKLELIWERNTSCYYPDLFKSVFKVRELVQKEDKDGIDEALCNLFLKGEKAGYALSEREITQLLEKDSISEKVAEVLISGDVSYETIKSVGKKFPKNKEIVKKHKEIADAKLSKVIKVITEIAVFAFVFIGCTALGVLFPSVSVFTGVAGIALLMAFHWFLWNKVKGGPTAV